MYEFPMGIARCLVEDPTLRIELLTFNAIPRDIISSFNSVDNRYWLFGIIGRVCLKGLHMKSSEALLRLFNPEESDDLISMRDYLTRRIIERR